MNIKNLEIQKEVEINHQVRLEFAKREWKLKTGYLILVDNQIAYYPTKKDWEKAKETSEYKQKYPQGEIFAATNLDLWHEWLKARDKINFR